MRFLGAEIGGNLDCKNGKFRNKDGEALAADGVKVKGAVFLSDGFEAEGEVRIVGAEIGGDLVCERGKFRNKDGEALTADRVTVKRSVYLRDGFEAEGVVSFVAARVRRYFIWRKIVNTKDVELDLRSARIGTLWDDEDSWPEKGKLFLHGLEYDGLDDEAPLDAKSRIDWLGRQWGDKYRPQPYNQLAKVLKNEGHEQDAKRILIEKEKLRAKHLSWISRPFHFLHGLLIGYGYRPWRAASFGLVIVLIGWVVFCYGGRNGVMVSTETTATQQKSQEECRSFSSFIYSVDTFVPLVDLRQAKYWLVNPMVDCELELTKKCKCPIKGYCLIWNMWF